MCGSYVSPCAGPSPTDSYCLAPFGRTVAHPYRNRDASHRSVDFMTFSPEFRNRARLSVPKGGHTDEVAGGAYNPGESQRPPPRVEGMVTPGGRSVIS